ncbi:hypothetical protein LBMAG56_09070 [Verrucomicrobiota bacterium]|nr:hypothetical protein LBMAG56_09070 [Verrucomicrobiota bacterium]
MDTEKNGAGGDQTKSSIRERQLISESLSFSVCIVSLWLKKTPPDGIPTPQTQPHERRAHQLSPATETPSRPPAVASWNHTFHHDAALFPSAPASPAHRNSTDSLFRWSVVPSLCASTAMALL